MGRGYIPPGLEAALGAGLGHDLCALLQFPLCLLLEALAHHLPGAGLDGFGLGGRDHLQKPLHGIEGTVGIFNGERLLMGPFIPDFSKFRDVASARMAELALEDLRPVAPHDHQKGLDIKPSEALFFRKRGSQAAQGLDSYLSGQGLLYSIRPPDVAIKRLKLALHEGLQARSQQRQPSIDPLMIAQCQIPTLRLAQS